MLCTDTTGQGEEDKKTDDAAATEATNEDAGGEDKGASGVEGEGEGDKKVEEASVIVEAEVQGE